MKTKVITDEKTVSQPVNVVWDIVSNSAKYTALGFMPGEYEKFDVTSASEDTKFRFRGTSGAQEMHLHIVDFAPKRVIGWGNVSSEWTVRIELSERGDHTHVSISRRILVASFLDKLMGKGGNSREKSKSMVKDSLEALSRACDRLKNEGADGLDEIQLLDTSQ